MPHMQNTGKYTLIYSLIFLITPVSEAYAQVDSELVHAGNYYTILGDASGHFADRIDIKYPDTYQYFHSAVKPYLRSEVTKLALQYPKSDSLGRVDSFQIDYLLTDNDEFLAGYKNQYYDGDLFDFFYSASPSAFYQFFTVKLNPVINSGIGFSSDTSEIRFLNTRGLEVRGSIDDKVGFYLYATDNQARFPAYVSERIEDHFNIVPGNGVAKIFKETGYDFPATHGYIGFNATKHIAIQFGQDKVFIGDGIRSMIWSDNSKDFLFLKINTHIWRINYQNLFAELGNVDGSIMYNSLVHKKYAAMHHLSIQLTKTINIGAFESVVFDRTDPGGNPEGFEFYYLNPIIFYRAVESGLGSSDNVLIGTNWKWNFLHRFSYYGQFVLDEFVFDQLFAGNGWWGNKYSFQSGLKYLDAFQISNLDFQFELNLARPYTYSYEDENASSYTNYGEPIAHPLGANFSEKIFLIQYQPLPKLSIKNELISANYGADTSGSNWGGNVFLDYNSYENEYGNEIGQGVSNQLFLNDFIVSWQCWHNIFIDGRFIYRTVASDLDSFDRNEQFFSIGIRVNDILRRYEY